MEKYKVRVNGQSVIERVQALTHEIDDNENLILSDDNNKIVAVFARTQWSYFLKGDE